MLGKEFLTVQLANCFCTLEFTLIEAIILEEFPMICILVGIHASF